jgi:hypothetical protein
MRLQSILRFNPNIFIEEIKKNTKHNVRGVGIGAEIRIQDLHTSNHEYCEQTERS